MGEPLQLRVALGHHDHVAPIRDGRVTSKRVAFDLIDFDPLPKAFRLMARGGDLDVSEMALVTHFLAHSFGRPLKAIAIPLWSRLPHTNLVCPVSSSLRGPADLAGRVVGVRSYAQTSGVWVRGVLASEYGVDLGSITWGTMEDAHLQEYIDPPTARRYTPPPSLRDLMMSGEFAAIMGERVVDPAGIRTVVPDAEAAALAWIARTGLHPINHVLAVKTDLVSRHPWLPDELMDMFLRAREIAIADGAKRPPEYGFRPNRESLQLCTQFSADQRVISRCYEVEEMFCPI